jgi:uncharacterized surface protein with fasciclin (FAS1) repeats
MQVVRYHFGVGAARYTKSLTQGVTQVLVFAPGAALEASTIEGKVVFKGDMNHAAVVTADVPLCNSVLHAVDTVLVPASQEKLLHSGAQRPASAQTAEL